MSVFTVDVRVTRPGRRPRWKAFRRVTVDTDAEMTWLPEVDLRSAGVETFKRDQLFVMANRRHVTRHVRMAVIRARARWTARNGQGDPLQSTPSSAGAVAPW